MGYISTGMDDRFGALLVSPMALRLALVDQKNLFSLVFKECYIFSSVNPQTIIGRSGFVGK